MNWKTGVIAFLSLFGGEKSQTEKLPMYAPQSNLSLPYDMTMHEAYHKGLVSKMSEYLHKMLYSPHSTVNIDTAIINKNNINKRICLGIYLDRVDSVYVHVFLGDTVGANQKETQQIDEFIKKYTSHVEYYGVLAHELKHKDTTLEIMRIGLGRKLEHHLILNSDFGPEDIILFNQHNEISARVATILQQREEYIKTGDFKSFSNFAKEYANAIKRGIFTPGKMTPYQEELENMYIVKTAFDWWQRKERKVNTYINRQKLTKWYSCGRQKRTDRNLLAYKFLMDICYTYIKDGHLQCMNYFCNPLNNKENENLSLADIEFRIKNLNVFTIPDLFNKPAVLCDAKPQEELLRLIPILQQKESLRIAHEERSKSQITAENEAKKLQEAEEYMRKYNQKQFKAKNTLPKQPYPKNRHFRQSAYITANIRKKMRNQQKI